MQVVVRALRVLRALAPHTRGVSLQELHERLDIPVGSLHRVLATLVEQGFVARSPVNRRYFLGPDARQLAQPLPHQGALLATPHDAVNGAAESTGETVFVTVLIGDRAVCVALSEGCHPLRLVVRIGQELPLHATAAARSLLAHLAPDAARRLLGTRTLTPFTPGTPVTVEAALEHLALIRARGYDVCDDELDRGVWGVAAPVFSSTGQPLASVTLAAPGLRMREPTVRAEAVRTVREAAGKMSAEFGYAGPSRPAATNGEARVRT
jgi:DNA-binding IclR family transcriptional regulator